MDRFFFSLGSLLAGAAVAAGAYGAHGATTFLGEDQARWIAKAARYQMYHALALLVVSWSLTKWPGLVRWHKIAGWLFLTGILLFSGSLYLMAFTGINARYLTPAGGITLMLGWCVMGLSVWTK